MSAKRLDSAGRAGIIGRMTTGEQAVVQSRAVAPGSRLLQAGGLAVLLACAGCAQVGAHQQRLVSKPNMEFSESLVFGYQHKLLPQVEPGSAFSAAAQGGGCTSCK